MGLVHLAQLWSCYIRHWLSVTNLSLSLNHFRSFLELSVDYINSKYIIWHSQTSSVQCRVSHCWSSHMAFALSGVNTARKKRKTHNTTYKLCLTCFSAFLFPIPVFSNIISFLCAIVAILNSDEMTAQSSNSNLASALSLKNQSRGCPEVRHLCE